MIGLTNLVAGVGGRTVPVRHQSAGVKCQPTELPREILYATNSRHRLGRTDSCQEVSLL